MSKLSGAGGGQRKGPLKRELLPGAEPKGKEKKAGKLSTDQGARAVVARGKDAELEGGGGALGKLTAAAKSVAGAVKDMGEGVKEFAERKGKQLDKEIDAAMDELDVKVVTKKKYEEVRGGTWALMTEVDGYLGGGKAVTKKGLSQLLSKGERVVQEMSNLCMLERSHSSYEVEVSVEKVMKDNWGSLEDILHGLEEAKGSGGSAGKVDVAFGLLAGEDVDTKALEQARQNGTLDAGLEGDIERFSLMILDAQKALGELRKKEGKGKLALAFGEALRLIKAGFRVLIGKLMGKGGGVDSKLFGEGMKEIVGMYAECKTPEWYGEAVT